MFKKQIKIENTVEIVSDLGISSSLWGDSRLVPALILDCTKNKGLSDLIEIHKDTPPGDVNSSWGMKQFSNRYVFLVLEFLKPMVLQVVIPFETEKHADLIDGIINANAVYLQEVDNNEDKSIDKKIQKSKVLIEIPSSTTFPRWPKLYKKIIIKRFQKDGSSKKAAREKAKIYMDEARKIWEHRRSL